jgi:dynein heavy chain, axonemal
MFLDDKD